MLYVVSIREGDPKKPDAYTIFETNTESNFRANADTLKKLLIEPSLKVMNMRLDKDKIVPEPWCRIHQEIKQIYDGAIYTLLCQLDKNTFKLAFYEKEATIMSYKRLMAFVEKDRVGNCSIKDGVMESMGTYNVKQDIKFKEQIDEKYEIFMAKCTLLGRNMTFEYVVEGEEVKLREYTGTDQEVIIPNFVTSITARAFERSGLTKLTLDNGIKSIGDLSFTGCNILELVIPKTVEFICSRAFHKNKKLVTAKGEYTNKITVLNPKTIIIKDGLH